MRRRQHEVLIVHRPTPISFLAALGRRSPTGPVPGGPGDDGAGRTHSHPTFGPRNHDDLDHAPTRPPICRPPRAHRAACLRSDRKPAGGVVRRRSRRDAPRLLRHLHRRASAGGRDLRRPLQRHRRHALRAHARRGTAQSLVPRPPSFQAIPLCGLRGRRRRWQADRERRGAGDRSGDGSAHEAQPPVVRRQRAVRRVGRSLGAGRSGGQLRWRERGLPGDRARWQAPAGGGRESGGVHPA